MTVEQYWKAYEAWVTPEVRRVARVAFFTGYAVALHDAGRHEEASAVVDALGEGKCG